MMKSSSPALKPPPTTTTSKTTKTPNKPLSASSARSKTPSLARLTPTKSSETYSLDALVSDLKSGKIKNVVVLAGAGISTPSGIADFRSPGTGLYNNLQKYNLPYAEAIFERDFFLKNPKPFFVLAKELYPDAQRYRPNKVHYFIRLLQDKKLLKRLYTQNIDGLERLAGIAGSKLIEAHGSFRTARCIRCNKSHDSQKVREEVMANRVPMCEVKSCSGVVKPDIIFFGEDLPDVYHENHPRDMRAADLILVMGTSLEVEPFSNLVGTGFAKPDVVRLLINRNSVGPFRLKSSFRKDVQMLGDLVSSIDALVDKLGWTTELESLLSQPPAPGPDGAASPSVSSFSMRSSSSMLDLERKMEDLAVGTAYSSPPSSLSTDSSLSSSSSSGSEKSCSLGKPPRLGLAKPNSKPYSTPLKPGKSS